MKAMSKTNNLVPLCTLNKGDQFQFTEEGTFEGVFCFIERVHTADDYVRFYNSRGDSDRTYLVNQLVKPIAMLKTEDKREKMSKRASLLLDQFRLFRNEFDECVSDMNDDDVDLFVSVLEEEVQKLSQYCHGSVDRYEAKVRDKPFKFDPW